MVEYIINIKLVNLLVEYCDVGKSFTVRSDNLSVLCSELLLSRLVRWQHSDDSSSPYARRLRMLLRGLRRTFGDVGWEIEWLDDGRICWLWKIAHG